MDGEMHTMKRSVRVLMVNHSYVRWINRLALDVLAKQDEIEVHVLAPEHLSSSQGISIAVEPDPKPTRYHLMQSRIRLNWLRGPYYDDMARLVHEVRPDIIYLGYEPGSLAAMQAVTLSRPSIKVVCFTVDNLYRTLRGEAGQRITRHDWVGAAGMMMAELMERYTLPRISYLLSCNEEARRTYHVWRGYQGPSQLIPLGIDTQRFRKLNVDDMKRRLGLNDFVIGYFGRLSREKGVHLLIEAVAQLQRPCHILIDKFVDALQDRQYLDSLQALADSYGIADRLVFFDAPHHEMPVYINCADCAVVPSITTSRLKEQYGRVIAEAMACEVVVIGSSSGNIPDLIGEAGLIFPEGDVLALRDALVRVMESQ